MKKIKPCPRCGRPKNPKVGKNGGKQICGQCEPVDAVWARLTLGPGDCWLYTGSISGGYGIVGGRLVHRLTYEFLIGEIPPGLDLDHLCLVTRCANPWHLEPVTRSENSRRRCAAHRQTHCKNGHEFTPENSYVSPKGVRSCRICTAASQRAYQRRKADRAGVVAS